jgi:hypothetical protein
VLRATAVGGNLFLKFILDPLPFGFYPPLFFHSHSFTITSPLLNSACAPYIASHFILPAHP